VPEEVLKQLKIIPVESMDEVLAEALIDHARPAARIKAERAARQKAAVRRPSRRRPASDESGIPVSPNRPADQPPAPRP